MTKFLLQVLCILVYFSALCTISALCDSDQVEINTASLENLDKISGIGPVLAQRIMDSRPFSSVDDLIKVNGIGNITLEKIKQQNLACVSNEKETGAEEETAENENLNETYLEENEINKTNSQRILKESSQTNQNTSRGVLINLSKGETKDIKSKKLEFNSEKFLIYGLITFSLFIAILFLLRKLKKPKTEFD